MSVEDMEKRPSCEADSHSSSQDIARFLWNPKVHYRVHKSSQLAPILNLMHLVHSFPSSFSKIISNIRVFILICYHVFIGKVKVFMYCMRSSFF